MAQFTAGGRLKSLFSGDGLSVGFDALHRRHYCGGGSCGRGLRFACLPSVPQRDRKRTAATRSSSPSSSSVKKVFDEILEEDHEVEIDELAGFRGLVLDISYRGCGNGRERKEMEGDYIHENYSNLPSKLFRGEFMDKADVLEYYDQTINSPSGSFYIPAVLRVPHLLQVVRRRTVRKGLSRKNIFHRDNYTCQYCSSCENLTIDHVLPIARGGKWTWENLVAACAKCNSKKGQKTLEEANMKLMKVPKAPKDYDILAIPLTNHAIKMLKTRNGMPEEWRQYLSKPYAAP